jgi:hypothetical protein
MAANLRRQKSEIRLRDAKFIEQQKLRQEEGPELWEKVQNQISIEGNALCADMEEDFLSVKNNGPSEMTITADMSQGPRSCKIGFSPVSGKLTWERENGSKGTFELAVGKNGKLCFFSDDVPVSVHHVAERILEELLQ